MKAYERVRRTVGEINDLLCTLNLATWDARVQMPARGGAARGRQLATLAGVDADLENGYITPEGRSTAFPQAPSRDPRGQEL